MQGMHESLIVDAIYILQELLKGITYQESSFRIKLCVSLLTTIVYLHRLILEIHLLSFPCLCTSLSVIQTILVALAVL